MLYVVATISKNSYSADKIEEILLAGANVLRFNFSHGTPAEMRDKLAVAREVIAKLRLENKVKILADLPGDKLRLGKFTNFEGGEFPVQKGQKITLTAGAEGDPNIAIPVDVDRLDTLATVGDVILIGDGEIALRATKIVDAQTFEAEVLNSRYLPEMKGISIGSSIDKRNHLTTQTLAHLAELNQIRPDWVAFSFINSGVYIDEARRLLNAQMVDGWSPKLMSKLESPGAMANLEEIVQKSDLIMVARGDLALTHPFEITGLLQKKIVQVAKKYGRPVIVATQILDSLLSYYTPQRAEVLDLTNCVLDEVEGIVLAKETGISLTPGYSIEVAKKIIAAVESGRYLL